MTALTQYKRRQVRNMYKEGYSTYYIAEIFGMSRTTISNYCKNIQRQVVKKIDIYRKALSPETITEVQQLYQQGYSTYYLAEIYYCCRDTIWQYVKHIKDRKERRIKFNSKRVEK